jgi:vitamin B12 transporter
VFFVDVDLQFESPALKEAGRGTAWPPSAANFSGFFDPLGSLASQESPRPRDVMAMFGRLLVSLWLVASACVAARVFSQDVVGGEAAADGGPGAEDAGVLDAAALDAAVDAQPRPSDSGAGVLDGAPDAEVWSDAQAIEAGQDDASSTAPIPIDPALAPLLLPLTPLSPATPRGQGGAPVEVVVRSRKSEAERLQSSSAAVTVVKLGQAKKRTSDLGEVLSRVPGISVRRGGSLGSDFRLSLNGLQGDQVRVFLDGVPLNILYATGLADVPPNLLERIEVYRGVVPIRLGSDALGGAINLVKPERYQTSAKGAYQIGSFGTHRASLIGRYRHDPSGFVAGVEGFFDKARNDYEINVEVPDERGRLSPAVVKRFHDAYQAYGVMAEVGVVDKPWAKKLLVRGFHSSYEKELQNNIVMTVPYGEVHYAAQTSGGMVHYQASLLDRVDLEVLGSYGRREVDFVDKSKWVYDWYGERVRERRQAGEISTPPVDQTVWQDTGFGRITADVPLAPGHTLVLNTSPYYAWRTGKEHLKVDPEARDPLTAERRLLSVVSGAEYMLRALPMPGASDDPKQRKPEDYRIENSFFGKAYTYRAWSEEPLPGDILKERNSARDTFGVGDMIRGYIVDWLLVKLSYEYATRLPTPDEVFGDAMLVHANLDLEPETSHNANFGPRSEVKGPKIGHLIVDINTFLRDTDKQIVLLGDDRFYTYQNVYRARSLGIEGATQWTSPGRWVELQFSLTYQDLRNQSTEGTFKDFKGDRLPNRPWLFGSWGSQLRFANLFFSGDELEPFYLGRYTQSFYRGWESVGLREYKQTIPTQLSHNIGITYGFNAGPGHLDITLECQNVTNALLFDFFGAQRAGSSFYAKISGDI